MIVQHSI